MRTGRSPARQDALREHNLALVLQHIAGAEPVSRARIAADTSLTKTTVSSLVDDLVSARLVTELGPEARGEIGRPGAPWRSTAPATSGSGWRSTSTTSPSA